MSTLAVCATCRFWRPDKAAEMGDCLDPNSCDSLPPEQRYPVTHRNTGCFHWEPIERLNGHRHRLHGGVS
jgi:hypothetical protein